MNRLGAAKAVGIGCGSAALLLGWAFFCADRIGIGLWGTVTFFTPIVVGMFFFAAWMMR